MNNTYKDQFTEWSPAYPVVFHFVDTYETESEFKKCDAVKWITMKTHNTTINAINKAMKK